VGGLTSVVAVRLWLWGHDSASSHRRGAGCNGPQSAGLDGCARARTELRRAGALTWQQSSRQLQLRLDAAHGPDVHRRAILAAAEEQFRRAIPSTSGTDKWRAITGTDIKRSIIGTDKGEQPPSPTWRTIIVTATAEWEDRDAHASGGSIAG